MPPAAGEQEGSELGPLHTVPQTAFPRTRQEDCVPLLNSYHYDILVAESH